MIEKQVIAQRNGASITICLGHCAVVALLAQDMFGGNILRVSLFGISEYAYMQSHYWNELFGIDEIDFTYSQFQNEYPRLRGEVMLRQSILSSSDMVRRYQPLVDRFSNYYK